MRGSISQPWHQTWAKTKCQMFNQLHHLGAPTILLSLIWLVYISGLYWVKTPQFRYQREKNNIQNILYLGCYKCVYGCKEKVVWVHMCVYVYELENYMLRIISNPITLEELEVWLHNHSKYCVIVSSLHQLYALFVVEKTRKKNMLLRAWDLVADWPSGRWSLWDFE